MNVIETSSRDSRYREKFDDLSEKAQEGERGASVDETAGKLETMTESLDEVYSLVRVSARIDHHIFAQRSGDKRPIY